MMLPCTLAQWELIPSIKAELAIEMKKLGLNQREIAKKLYLTPAAVSQYVSHKRGKKVSIPQSVHKFLTQLAEKITKGADEEEIMNGICAVCEITRHEQEMIKKYGKGITKCIYVTFNSTTGDVEVSSKLADAK